MYILYTISKLVFANSTKIYFFNCIYVYVYDYNICIYLSSMLIYFIVYQLYHMFYRLSANSSIILSIDFRQCSSCFIDFLIIVKMVLQDWCMKLTQLFYND